MKATGFCSSLIGIILTAFGAASGQAQDITDLQRLMTRDAILVSQAIGWALEGPVSAKEAAPVVFSPGVMPKPVATRTMFTRNVLLIDYATPQEAPTMRGLTGVIELADRADHRILARFETGYEIASGAYRVDLADIHPVYPDTPRIEAYFVPAGVSMPSQSPYAMLEAIRRNAVDPASTLDGAPRQYRVYVVGMDRLSPQADLGFTAIDATNGKTIAKSQSLRQDGWVVATLPAAFAVNGKNGVFFPIAYRPDGTPGSERILMMFSNRFGGGAPSDALTTSGGPAAMAALPPPPPLSTLGQAFIAKGLANQVAQP